MMFNWDNVTDKFKELYPKKDIKLYEYTENFENELL